MQGNGDDPGQADGKSFAVESHRRGVAARLKSVRAVKGILDPIHRLASVTGTIGGRVGADHPAVLPAIVDGAARGRGIAVKDAHHYRLAFLDGLRARVLHIANQAVDLGRNAIRRGHVLERRYAYGHQDRDEGDDDHHLEDREARAIPHAGVHLQRYSHAGKTTQASLREPDYWPLPAGNRGNCGLHHRSARFYVARGKRMRMRVPRPCAAPMLRLAPCARAISSTIARPSPQPVPGEPGRR